MINLWFSKNYYFFFCLKYLKIFFINKLNNCEISQVKNQLLLNFTNQKKNPFVLTPCSLHAKPSKSKFSNLFSATA